MTRADLLATARRYHTYAVNTGDLEHAEDFDACPHKHCALIRAYVAIHEFDYVRPEGWHCEACGGAWPTLDEALAVRCAA